MKITYTHARLFLTLLLSSTLTYGMFWSCCKKSSVVERSQQSHELLSEIAIQKAQKLGILSEDDGSDKNYYQKYIARQESSKVKPERLSEQSQEGEWV